LLTGNPEAFNSFLSLLWISFESVSVVEVQVLESNSKQDVGRGELVPFVSNQPERF
jgi:hypothetical protein